MKKREIIEGSFGMLCTQVSRDHYCETLSDFIDYLGDALAEQAIAIECEVEHLHWEEVDGRPYTLMMIGKTGKVVRFGHHGTPGKALAIIIPLEEER